MKVLKFKLSGETAFFKKPDVNTFIYFTYGCIHKVAYLDYLEHSWIKGYNNRARRK